MMRCKAWEIENIERWLMSFWSGRNEHLPRLWPKCEMEKTSKRIGFVLNVAWEEAKIVFSLAFAEWHIEKWVCMCQPQTKYCQQQFFSACFVSDTVIVSKGTGEQVREVT